MSQCTLLCLSVVFSLCIWFSAMLKPTCCTTMQNSTQAVFVCGCFCSSTRTWMFGLDCDSDDGRSFKVDWREGWAGRRCGDGGRLENEFLHATNTCRDTNNIKLSCIQKTSQTVLHRILNLIKRVVKKKWNIIIYTTASWHNKGPCVCPFRWEVVWVRVEACVCARCDGKRNILSRTFAIVLW